MVKGLRVAFSLNPASRMLYSYRVPEAGTRGTITAVRMGGASGRTSRDRARDWSTSSGTEMVSSAPSPCGTSSSSRPRTNGGPDLSPSILRAAAAPSQ